MTPPLVVTLYGPRDCVVWVEDGCAWRLVGDTWVPLTHESGGLVGHVLTLSQREALVARVGAPEVLRGR